MEFITNNGRHVLTLFILFLHYPPTSILDRHSGFTDMAEEYGAEQVIYAHGQSRSRDVSTEWSIDWFLTISGLEC